MTDATAALDAARRGRAALRHLDAQQAAWYALHAVELDATCGLGWALLGHLLAEQSSSPLGAWVIHHALTLGLPPVEHQEIARYHRIDLWNRGLMAHASGQATIKGKDVDDGDAFRPTERLGPFFAERLAEWGGDPKVALRAAQRMVGAMSDAWSVPVAQNALSGDTPWTLKVPYTKWVEAGPLKDPAPPAPTAPAPVAPDISVLSDYWMSAEINDLVAAGKLPEAEAKAKAWSELRGDRMTPQVTLAQVRHARGDTAGRNKALALLPEVEADVDELEATRIALVGMDVWPPQLDLLDRMDAEMPGHPIIMANRGITKLKTGDVEGAEADLQASFEADPSSIPTLANLALVRMQTEQYAEAREMLEKAHVAAPDEPDVLVYLAVCKTNTGDTPGAVADLNAALKLAPDHGEAKRILAEIS